MHWLLQAPTTVEIYVMDGFTWSTPKFRSDESAAQRGSTWTTRAFGPRSGGAFMSAAIAMFRWRPATSLSGPSGARFGTRYHGNIFELRYDHRVLTAYFGSLLRRGCRRKNHDSRRLSFGVVEWKADYSHGTALRRGHVIANQVVFAAGSDALLRTGITQRYLTRIAPAVVP